MIASLTKRQDGESLNYCYVIRAVCMLDSILFYLLVYHVFIYCYDNATNFSGRSTKLFGMFLLPLIASIEKTGLFLYVQTYGIAAF